MNHRIRPERRFENYSRGTELARAIQGLWNEVRALPHSRFHDMMDRGIAGLRKEFDLTEAEWYYWSHLISVSEPAS